MNPARLWRFHGGLALPGHKADTTRLPLSAASVPERLVFPLPQGDGWLEPVVSPGERVLKYQTIARDPDQRQPPLHASSSGRIAAIAALPLPHPSGLTGPCIVVETDGADTPLPCRGVADYRHEGPAALRLRLHEAGVVGLGGAGYPTAQKLAPRPVDILVLNGTDCEPYLSCDELLLRQHAAEVLLGAQILRHILGAERILLALQDNQPEAHAAATAALRAGGYPDTMVQVVPARYPVGAEGPLIHLLTGRELPSGGVPADIGVACQNVATAAAVAAAVVQGQPLIARIVTLAGGGLHQPRNLWARIGTPIAHLVAHCGGYRDTAEHLILGGPLTGFALPRDDLPIGKTTRGILVAGRGELTGAAHALPCIRCGACHAVCPVRLLPQQLFWYGRSGQLDHAADHQLLACIECGCCDLVCPSGIPLLQTLRATKGQLLARQRERERAERARRRFEARQARQAERRRVQAEAAARRKAALEQGAQPEIREALERVRQKRAGKRVPTQGSPPA
ncbi:electron transport complex subunit RsxC [Candidatus Methylocalor cossyra]|uniref:Ion-translocating oxidoreductase complex subunit C n=1 Tax=Candidatus Methylocalor cossyra TaxID=3108543 RepID=A0ABP1C5L0_9GAMM